MVRVSKDDQIATLRAVCDQQGDRITELESCARELLAYIEANGTDATAHLLLGKYSKTISE